ncbi:MAG TPA: hypothetical protein VGO11_05015 [Chthoniobacteraceae bacterium]|jgi:hypothetical protein|nr:hypothetical protein [Chthoniobacteraceae bacterium]
MRICALLLALATGAWAQNGPTLPDLVQLKQDEPRAHPKLKLPAKHTVGPTIPGLTQDQGATPQGLAYWEHEKQKWLLISCYFHKEGHPSVVVALDAGTGAMVRCLTFVEPGGKVHVKHVGGLAVSGKYLWVGSERLLYRAPLAALAAAKPVDYLQLQPQFEPHCTASTVAFHDQRVWVAEFVSLEDGIAGNPEHYLKDRNGTHKSAWAAGYALDANEDLVGLAGGKRPVPAAILSIRQKVQGMAFLDGRIILSTSYGRTADSTLAAYTDPLQNELTNPHATTKVGSATVPLWFLDGQNRQWEIDNYPPMSEGITAYGKRLGVICESGAEEYQKGGRGPLDTVIFLTPPVAK